MRGIEKTLSKVKGQITGPKDLIGDAKPSALFSFMVGHLSHLMSCDISKMLSKRSVRTRRVINPIIRHLARAFLEYKQVFESKNALLGIEGPDKLLSIPKEPVIWCGNHGFKDDAGATVSCIRHSYILFGSLPAFFNTFDGISAYLNGVILCNRKVKSSKKASFKGMLEVMKMGTDLMIFPEGVWNKTPDKLLLYFWPGIYQVAKETKCSIIPVVNYLADAHKKYPGNVIHTVICEPISISDLSENEGLTVLRDTIATWFYLLMEKYGQTTRKELLGEYKTSDDAWEAYLTIHTGAVKYYDREIELCADYRPRSIVRPEDVWQSIARIDNIQPWNIKHVVYANSIVQREKRRDFQRRY